MEESMTEGASNNSLEHLFYPRSIAVVGASPDGDAFRWGGKTFIEGLVKQNYRGNVYPVHPKAQTVCGIKAYKNVCDIPDQVDLAIFSVPASAVMQVMADCVKKQVKFVHVFTAGFTETGLEDRARLEAEMAALARSGGVRVIGPNCMGVYCPDAGVAWVKDFPATSGPVAFVSQSGQLAGHFIEEGGLWGIQFSKVISFGNASDLQIHEFLHYLANDEKTGIIGAYIEGLKDGRAFFDVVRSLTLNKPLVVWKGGQTEGGSRAVSSHTASIAGSRELWQALCKQTGVIPVNNIEELVANVAALQCMGLPRGRRVAIVGGAGGGSVTMTDAAERANLLVPQLSEESIRGLSEFVPVHGQSVKNPLDIFSVLVNYDHFMRMIELLRDDPNIDALIYFQRVEWALRRDRIFLDMAMQMAIDGTRELKKPLYIALAAAHSLEGELLRREAQKKYAREGIATFPSFEAAACAAYNLSEYQRYLSGRK
ncbi:MAG: acetyl-CoA synthetase [Candidatus Abyssobacteria bacterium SURF_5]|uniref:Acetyl-CoA synthetase n=1 Tax=Abyssobacteria bacterium (strain SURF_5) TaxID=2093360 RepID=A0A3A4P8K3_ABYX5|nr:MAG: acetyl-CoA synthetase [Candidatus Abyssubacteria bacterium SURF_5]